MVAAGVAIIALTAAGYGGAGDPEITARDFDPSNFTHSTSIDNRWFPLLPGTRMVFTGSTREEGKRIAHRVVFVVTDLSKIVNRVRVRVVWERDWSGGRLEEAELAFFAQDERGNVWHLGQYPEVYEEGKLVEAPAWVAGTKGARAGIAMKAEPKLGAPDYSQGFAPPPINWVDRAEVRRVGARTCVPYGCFDDVLITREFEIGKPDAYQLKYYARGVGNVRVGWLGSKDKDHEVLVLVERTRLTANALARARAGALALERRAYRIRTAVYGATTPAIRTP